MCGIIAFIGKGNAWKNIVFGLKQLRNRGYDSAGICIYDNNNYKVKKYTKGAIESLSASKYDSYIGIGHTRWATHGKISEENAHPHLDYKERVALVHNGIIENYQELKNFLLTKNITFKSETDTEVIVNLIGYYLDNGYDNYTSITMAIEQLKGTWALVIIIKNKLYISRNGSPLLVGFSDNSAVVASESSGFPDTVKHYICLNEGETQVLSFSDEVSMTNLDKYQLINYYNKNDDTSPFPYEYWTIKEIMHQSKTVLDALKGRMSFFSENASGDKIILNGLEKLREMDNLIILGCGTSYFAGTLGLKYFREMECFDNIQVIDGAEFTYKDIPKKGRTALLLLSQSGETKDLHRCIPIAKEKGIFVLSIVNVEGSLIARDSDCCIYLKAGRENGVASTKSFTSQVLVLLLVALWLKADEKWYRSLVFLPNAVCKTLELNEKCREIASKIKEEKHIFILGKGFSESIAKEGSLKIKEISYIHAEGYSGGSLKHGPFALIEKNTPIILIMPDDEHFNKMMNAAEEVKCRGANVIIITDREIGNDNIFDDVITIPKCGKLAHLLAVIPLQLLAYELSIQKGINPDFPRNLAKVVTVD
jgi:glucosamine--fructose-6-phosphate aminotransferase (isomerizing)